VSEVLEISPDLDVHFGIAQRALDQVDDIVAIAPLPRVGEFLTGRRAKGIAIERSSDEASARLNVRVGYGERIPELALAAQRVMRDAVASMTVLAVVKVHVPVDSIDLPEDLHRG
jgi:uncharacterized alkaline shock family protein YloU